MPNSLASARSIFEQNIQKNKEAGCDKNILGQKTGTSRVVARRLFAHNKLSDDSNESHNGVHLNQQHQRRRSSVSSQLSSISSHSSTAAAIRLNTSKSQSKGQTTIEVRRSSAHKPPLAAPPKESNYPARSSIQPATEKISKSFPFKDALAKQQEKKRGSISSLADHLGKLELRSLQGRGDGENSLNSSRSSLEAHRDHFKLPDFRQSSYVKRSTSQRLSQSTANKNKGQQEPLPDDSISSLGSYEGLDMSNSNRSSSSLSLSPTPQDGSLDDSSNHIRLKRSSSRRTLNSPMNSPNVNNRLSSRNNKSLAAHLAKNGRRNTGAWIRPSSVTEDDDSCSSSHHSQPFKSVPFTKTVIKRHEPANRRESTASLRRASSRKSFSPNNSNHSLNNNSSASNKSGMRRSRSRRNSMSSKSTSSKSSTRRPKPPKPDPDELAFQEQIEALQRQIQASEAKLVQVQEGEQFDLKRVRETKERKLRRIENAEKRAAPPPPPLKPQQKVDPHQTKLLVRQLKQQNAKIHDENRKLKVANSSTRTSNRLLEEGTVEIKQFHQELVAQQKRDARELDQLMSLAATYQQSILELEEAIEKKTPAVQRVKSARLQLEDKIDILVAFMQKKCSDFELVEELTILAGFDESGWEDGETDESEDESDSEEEVAMSRTAAFIRRYSQKIESDEESPRSVSDLLMPISSHSLHLFVE